MNIEIVITLKNGDIAKINYNAISLFKSERQIIIESNSKEVEFESGLTELNINKSFSNIYTIEWREKSSKSYFVVDYVRVINPNINNNCYLEIINGIS